MMQLKLFVGVGEDSRPWRPFVTPFCRLSQPRSRRRIPLRGQLMLPGIGEATSRRALDNNCLLGDTSRTAER
jgi:hypothetical protein